VKNGFKRGVLARKLVAQKRRAAAELAGEDAGRDQPVIGLLDAPRQR
jgi:hypothetical protein